MGSCCKRTFLGKVLNYLTKFAYLVKSCRFEPVSRSHNSYVDALATMASRIGATPIGLSHVILYYFKNLVRQLLTEPQGLDLPPKEKHTPSLAI